MTEDEKAIRELVETWMEATKRGDRAAVLDLMSNDVVFMAPGAEPFGKTAFAESFESMKAVKIEGRAEIVELQVLGEWAFVRNRLEVKMEPPNAAPVHRAGYTLTLLRKEADGRWRLARDANLLATQR